MALTGQATSGNARGAAPSGRSAGDRRVSGRARGGPLILSCPAPCPPGLDGRLSA